MAATAAQKLGALATEASEKIRSAASKVREENKEACDNLDNLCGGVCAFLAVVWAAVLELVTSAFFPYLFVTFSLNILPFAYGLASVFSYACNSRWLFFNALLAAMHMMTSVYTVVRIREGCDASSTTNSEHDDDGIVVDENGETPYVQAGSPEMMGDSNSWERIRKVMCYDLAMAIYYILCLIWIMWQGLGTKKIIEGDVEGDCNRWVLLSVVCGFLYMGLGVVAWTVSLCFLRYNKLSHSRKDVLAVDENGGISLA